MSALVSFRDDLDVAVQVARHFGGRLTPVVRGGVEGWFQDVDRETVFPLAELELSPEERSKFLRDILAEMLSVVESAIAAGLDDDSAFSSLGSTLDPLYREFQSLHAPVLNAEWRRSLPQSDLEREGRIEALIMMTGMDRHELIERAEADRQLRAMISQIGVSLDDLRRDI